MTPGSDVVTPPDGGAGEVLARIDQYELVRELGGGGFGTVYLARDTGSGAQYAVKGLPPLVQSNQEELENIRAKFLTVSKLNHTHITVPVVLQKVHEAAYAYKRVADKFRVFAGDFLAVMQFAPGVTLSQWARQFPGGKAPVEDVLPVLRQIASALDYAHGERIIHRDIKPANVMVETKKDGTSVARVLDFGLAAEVRSSMGRVSRAVTDTSGTPPYMAPEQWAGCRQDAATDQYAFAALAAELLTGEVPFAGVFDTGDIKLMAHVVCHKKPEFPSDLPRPRRQALLRALAKDPKARFPSCTAFVEALEGRARHPVRAVVGAAFLLAAAGGFCWWQSRQAPAAAAPQAPAPAPAPVVEPTPAVKPASVAEPSPAPAPVVEPTPAVKPAPTPPVVVAPPAPERPDEAALEKAAEKAVYKVIDLATGQVEDLAAVPAGGWTEEHKTSKLVLRRIEPGTFTMGSPDGTGSQPKEEGRYGDEVQHSVTLTKPYYLGVFEVTQG